MRLVSATLFHRLLKDRAAGSVVTEFMSLPASGNVNQIALQPGLQLISSCLLQSLPDRSDELLRI